MEKNEGPHGSLLCDRTRFKLVWGQNIIFVPPIKTSGWDKYYCVKSRTKIWHLTREQTVLCSNGFSHEAKPICCVENFNGMQVKNVH